MLGWLASIPSGDAGTYATLATMRQMTRRAALIPIVRQTAAGIMLDVPGSMMARMIGLWVEDRVRFLPDPWHAEALHDPAWSLAQILTRGLVQLDCDDVAMLAAALALSVGLRAKFVAVGFHSPNAPFRHVWTEVAHPQSRQWVTVDPTRPAQGLDGLHVSRRVERAV